MPPLRERREEIPILAEHFLQKYSRQYNRAGARLSRELLERFQGYPWPGNVRELENLVKRIVVLENQELALGDLLARGESTERQEAGAAVDTDRSGSREGGRETAVRPLAKIWAAGAGLKEVARRAAREAEREAIEQVLGQVRWNRVEAARRLQISYKALLYKISMYALAVDRPARGSGVAEQLRRTTAEAVAGRRVAY